MNYVGIDYHKKYSHVTAVNKEGHVIKSMRLDNAPEAFEDFFRDLDGPSQTVLEASRTWGVLFDLLEATRGVESVTLANPGKVRAIAEAKIKTDKIDAETLAQLLRANLIPAAYIPGKDTRMSREMIRQRIFLVRMRTRLKNRIHVLLDRLHLPLPAVTDLFGKRGIDYLRGLKLEGVDAELLQEDLELLAVFNRLIKEAEGQIDRLLSSDPRVQLLRTVPGLGPILAAVIALEIDRVERFRHPAKLAAYAGLVPSTHASGGRIYHGHLLPMSNKWLRWALVEAAWVAIRGSAYCRAFFEARKRRKGPHTAVIALARRLSEIIWHVLSERRSYEERSIRARAKGTGKEVFPAALTTT